MASLISAMHVTENGCIRISKSRGLAANRSPWRQNIGNGRVSLPES